MKCGGAVGVLALTARCSLAIGPSAPGERHAGIAHANIRSRRVGPRPCEARGVHPRLGGYGLCSETEARSMGWWSGRRVGRLRRFQHSPLKSGVFPHDVRAPLETGIVREPLSRDELGTLAAEGFPLAVRAPSSRNPSPQGLQQSGKHDRLRTMRARWAEVHRRQTLQPRDSEDRERCGQEGE